MFEFKHLDERTRALMLKEAELDGVTCTEYYGKRLTIKGRTDWSVLMRDAIGSGNTESLAADLRGGGRLKTHEERNTKNGVVTAAVPVNAADVLAQGEFNRLYIRALCLRIEEDGGTELIVCRGRASANPRPESEAIIGRPIGAGALRKDIMDNPGGETMHGIPLVNSGLTVRLP